MKMRKQRIFEIIQIGNRGDLPSRLFDYFIVVCIFLNILVLFMGTFEAFAGIANVLDILEAVTIGIFTVEYLLRLWTADLLYPGICQPRAALRFVRSFDGIIDLLTILPFFFLSGFVALRILRVVRIFRLFRINASYDSFNVIANVFKTKKNQIFSSVFIILMLMLVSSLCIYSAEHDAQPELYCNAFSGIWWSLSTIFTVGYGDIYPITTLGRIMTVILTFLGVGAVAIPTGIISAGFVEQYTEIAQAKRRSPEAQHTMLESVGSNSPYIGMTVDEIDREFHCVVIAVERDGQLRIPSAAFRIEQGDTCISQRT